MTHQKECCDDLYEIMNGRRFVLMLFGTLDDSNKEHPCNIQHNAKETSQNNLPKKHLIPCKKIIEKTTIM